jgi:transposase
MLESLNATLEWIERHPGLAGYLQAAGGILIIVATIYIASKDRRERKKSERLRAEGIAVQLVTEMVGFKGQLKLVINRRLMRDSLVQAPTILYRLIESLYLLGAPGESFHKMLSMLAANNIMVEELQRTTRTLEEENEAWAKFVGPNLDSALASCDEGIEGLYAILKNARHVNS